ncbi:MAG: hypothetical protein R3C68_16385 [Myxococcota bacterium]
MIRQSREAGYRQVLVTGGLDLQQGQCPGISAWMILSPMSWSTSTAIVRGIKHPLLAAPIKATWIRRYAETYNQDLEQCLAYQTPPAIIRRWRLSVSRLLLIPTIV